MTRLTKRERVIKRLNDEFADVIGCIIPIDQPITIQRRTQPFKESQSWYFKSKYAEREDLNIDIKLKKNDAQISTIGSYYTMTELLEHKRWRVIRDDDELRYSALGGLDIEPLED